MSNKTTNKNRGRLSGGSIAAICIIAAIAFLVFFVILRATGVGAYTESEEAKNGELYISSIEKRDVNSVSQKVNSALRAGRVRKAEQKLESLDDEETDIWTLFDGIIILGDSRSEGFTGYDFLPESVVFAKKGANLKYADEDIDKVVAKQPDCLIFAYGVNDVTGNWKTAEDFIKKYKELLSIYRERLPDTDIFVCSLIPVTKEGIEQEPTLEALPEYAWQIENMCDDEGYIFIDCDSLSEYSDEYERDGMHFKKPIYPIWGKMLLRKVLTYESNKLAENSD